MEREPIRLLPSAKDYLWGGRRLNDEFAKGIDLSPLAETWECSTHPDGPSYVTGGVFDGMSFAEVLKLHPEFLGTRHRGETELPILVKLIDAKRDLSVQVHPTDEFAVDYEGQPRGKSEFWYILDAARDAKLIYGLKETVDRETVRRAVETGSLSRYLQQIPVQKDDLFFVPAGTIHAVGAGTLLAEIQESSNLTYRIYDYDRVDKNGQRRQLHVDKALRVACLERAPEPRQPLRVLRYRQGTAAELLCRCKYFEVHRVLLNTERRQQVRLRADPLSFRVLLCIGGCGTIAYGREAREYYKGDCIFIPADSAEITLHGQARFLDIRG